MHSTSEATATMRQLIDRKQFGDVFAPVVLETKPFTAFSLFMLRMNQSAIEFNSAIRIYQLVNTAK